MRRGIHVGTHVDSLNCTVWILGHHYDKIGDYLANSPNWKLVFVGRAAAVYVHTKSSEWTGDNVILQAKLGGTSNMIQTARIINSLLRSKRLDLALQVADEARQYWKDSLNEGKSQRAYDFVLGSQYFIDKNDELAFEHFSLAHIAPAVITNTKKLKIVEIFATGKYWKSGKYKKAFHIAKKTLAREPDNPMLQYNTAFLSLHFVNAGGFNWRDNLNKMLKTKESNDLGIPVNYFSFAEKMLETGKPVNVGPLKYKDER